MDNESDKNKYVGSYGLPPKDDPMFNGKVIIAGRNTVSSESHATSTKPTQNAPDNSDFRNALKNYLVAGGFIKDDEFGSLVEREWKKIKKVENHLYYFHGELEPNVASCACILGFYHKK
jgi:hypothetical protein